MRQDLQQQLLAELVIESLEGLDAFDAEMLALEKGEGDREESLRNAFRYIHTVKGSSGCLGLTPVERVAHAAENVMSSLREGRLPVTSEVISGLLRSSDRLRDMMQVIEGGGRPDPNTDSDLINLLDSLQDLPAPPDPAPFGFFDQDEISDPNAAAYGFFDEDPVAAAPDVVSPLVAVTAEPQQPLAQSLSRQSQRRPLRSRPKSFQNPSSPKSRIPPPKTPPPAPATTPSVSMSPKSTVS